ncbi:MAG: wax ester/triacylglycerol synthase family O-acyltransferase [Candidatus Binatia bacterium]|nr:wax ester/triacylglycerol synthase family O-acyltransferase [Candidatus Binatia bacterium]
MKKVDRSRGGWKVVGRGAKVEVAEERSGSRPAEPEAAPAQEAPFSWVTDAVEAITAEDESGDEKLSALDAGFLFLEKPHQNFQIGCVAMLDTSPGLDALVETLDERLAEFPRFRQMPIRAKFDLGWPVWRDDPEYDTRRHIRHVAIPRPGDREKLSHVLETLVTTALPSDRPRWEIHLIEGLEHGRAALLCKVHHSMNDGISGFHVLETIADGVAKVPEKLAAIPLAAADPADAPTTERPERKPDGGLVGLLSEALADPRGTATRGIRDLAEAAETIASFLEEPPANMPWNGSLGQGRQIVWRSYPMDEFTSLKVAADGTINDAVLAIVSGALRTYALQNGHSADDGALRCIVPASIREKGDEAKPGNQVTAMFPRLPVDVADPAERLYRVRDEMRNLKERKQARATTMVLAVAGALPSFTEASLLSATSDLSMVNTLCTNVPGPKQALHVCGKKITEIHAIAPLFLDVGLAFAAASYADRISICAVADPALVPDIERIGNALDAALYETRRALWRKSEAMQAASRLSRGPTVADLMSRNVATVGVDDSLQRAHELMRGRRLSHLPVVDREARLIGVLTQRDLLFASPQVPAKLNTEDRARMLGRFAVGRAVDAKLTTASPDEPVLDAGKRMVENQLDFLPVVDAAGQLLGLVTEDHIVRWTTRTQAH